MSERDKFLTEAMGLCWHEEGEDVGICRKCGVLLPGLGIACPDGNSRVLIERKPDFNTWLSFGILFEWAQVQKWWIEFLFRDYATGHDYEELSIKKLRIYTLELLKFINPTVFADAIYQFLQERR